MFLQCLPWWSRKESEKSVNVKNPIDWKMNHNMNQNQKMNKGQRKKQTCMTEATRSAHTTNVSIKFYLMILTATSYYNEMKTHDDIFKRNIIFIGLRYCNQDIVICQIFIFKKSLYSLTKFKNDLLGYVYL